MIHLLQAFSLRQRSTYISKGAKECFVLDMFLATDAISELEDTWDLSPDHMFQKSWPVFLKSSTRSLHFLWGNRRFAKILKYTLTETTASEFRQHSSSPSLLSLHIPVITFCLFSFLSCSLSSSPFRLPSFLVHFCKVFPNVISAVLKASELFQKSLVCPLVIHSP